jgi:serine/threonine-protein kinase RsbW
VPTLSSSRPPAPSTEVAQWVLDSFTELRSLRASLHKTLTGEPLPEDGLLDEIPEKVAVVATELATNALAHARPPTVVRLRRTEDAFILDVTDEDPAGSPSTPRTDRRELAVLACSWLATLLSRSAGTWTAT